GEKSHLLWREIAVERPAPAIVAVLERDHRGVKALGRVGHPLERPGPARLLSAEIVEDRTRRSARKLGGEPVARLERDGQAIATRGRVVVQQLVERGLHGRLNRDRKLRERQRVSVRRGLVGGGMAADRRDDGKG